MLQMRAVGARNLVLVTGVADRELELVATKSAHDKVGVAVSRLRDAIAAGTAAEQRKLHDKMVEIESRYGLLALEIVGMALKDQADAAVAKMNAECRPLQAALIGASNDYLEFVKKQAEASVGVSNAKFPSSRTTMATLPCAAIGLAVLMAWILTRAIVDPITRAVAIAQTVASGDLPWAIHVESKDETGQLMQALKDMNDGLVNIVGNVRTGSESIVTGSAQIAAGRADLSARTEQQAASLQQTATKGVMWAIDGVLVALWSGTLAMLALFVDWAGSALQQAGPTRTATARRVAGLACRLDRRWHWLRVMQRIAAPIVGGMVTTPMLSMLVRLRSTG